jgi:hypothetical protein
LQLLELRHHCIEAAPDHGSHVLKLAQHDFEQCVVAALSFPNLLPNAL